MPTTFSPSPLVTLGDKVVTDINAAGPWTPSGGSAVSFTARRVYFFDEYQPTNTDLHVDLLIAELTEEEIADRSFSAGADERTYMVAIGVQKVVTDRTSASEVDALVNFVEALRDFYALEQEFTVSGSQKARCVKREVPVVYSPDELDKNGRFFSVLHLTFAGWF